jgi:hypothetical protein
MPVRVLAPTRSPSDSIVAAEQDVIQQKIAALAGPKAKVVELKK